MQNVKKSRIAFLGLGIMGTGMARRLLQAGHEVTVFNRNMARAEALVSEGAHAANSPADAVRSNGGADVIISMLADDVASKAIWLGDDGALAGTKKGAVGIECSTVTVAWVRQLAAAAADRGMKFLDAPVTGTKPHAANGELTFLVGGEAEVLELVRPILAVMSKEIIHLGLSSSGSIFKLINNFLCGVQAAALAEAYAFLQREGLDLQKAMPVLMNGAPGSGVSRQLVMRHGNRDYTPNFKMNLLAKDMSYAIAEAQSLGLALETASAALARLKQAIAAGLGDEDMSAVIKHLQR